MRMFAVVFCAALFAVWDAGFNHGQYTGPAVHFMKYYVVR